MKPRSAAYLLARAVMALLGGTLGMAIADLLLRRNVLVGPNNLLYLTLVGLLLGYLVSAPVGRAWAGVWQNLTSQAARVPPEAVLAAGTGATVALLIAVLLNNVLADVPGFTWYWSLLIAIILVVASSSFFVANRRLFGALRVQPETPVISKRPMSGEKIIDTSAIIDGRIVEVLESNFLDSPILIPRFVLLELQRIADSGDPLRRRRGRRGLEVLDRLAQQTRVPTQVISDEPEDSDAVDEKLMAICMTRSADLITTDYNLDRVATLQGITVLNLNQLANAVKASFLPGERLSLSIVREGREPGQGLAYLEDGTMVVIEDAAGLVGTTMETVVTSSLQTNMGRMIFARPAEDSDS